MKKLVGVVIGCGAIAREHLTALAKLKNVEVAGVCDLSEARVEATAERFAVPKWYTDYQRMLGETRPDLVHITTPPGAHFPIAKYCLANGFNVLCEKPIAVTYDQFLELKQLALQNNRILMENHNFRFHSSIRRISDLLKSGSLGEVVDVQILLSLDIMGDDSPYLDRNVPHSASALRGGVIGDFLPHIAYLAAMFAGPAVNIRTVWTKRVQGSPLPADEFRGFIKGERATAYVGFSANAQPNGFWIRVAGSRMHIEADLYAPPRVTVRRLRSGEPALANMLDGIAESRAVLRGAVGGLWRKLAGTSSYDGLGELISRTYRALETNEKPPVSLEDVDEAVRIVDRFTRPELQL
jgi:predicted dehydrogenase